MTNPKQTDRPHPEESCPLCRKGEPITKKTIMALGKEGGRTVECEAFWCECSTRECPAQLIYPRDTEDKAIGDFISGKFAEPQPFADMRTGRQYSWNREVLWRRLAELLDRYSPEQVERLGADPFMVESLAAIRPVQNGEPRDTGKRLTAACPRCGKSGRYRKARNPITGDTDADCWWRIGCSNCRIRTRWAFPTREGALRAWSEDDLARIPDYGRGLV